MGEAKSYLATVRAHGCVQEKTLVWHGHEMIYFVDEVASLLCLTNPKLGPTAVSGELGLGARNR